MNEESGMMMFFFSVVYLTGRMDSDGFWLQ